VTWPVPTPAELADYTGRPVTSYTSYVNSALLQATMMFTILSELSADDYSGMSPDYQQLASMGIMAMADWLYLRWPYAQVMASPLQNETIGSYCVDVSTEILTASGWQQFYSLRPEDEVLTLNPETWMTEWQPCQAVYVFPPQEREMLLMESARFSSLTTLDHRWLTRMKSGRTRWTTSRDLNSQDQIPVAAMHAELPAEAKYSDALTEVVAWFWTEGSWNWEGRCRSITIHQSHAANSGKCDRIRTALTRLFGPDTGSVGQFSGEGNALTCEHEASHRACGLCPSCYMKYWRSPAFEPSVQQANWTERRSTGRPGMSSFVLSAPASEVITQHITASPDGAKTVSTEFLRSLTQAQLELFVHVSLLADGTFAGNNRNVPQLLQRDRAAAEQFALACILAGKRVSIRQVQSGMWMVTLSQTVLHRPWNAAHLSKASRMERVFYSGPVWCPRTQNGTWLARRNGTVYFTGNSYSKPLQEAARNAQAVEVTNEKTGVDMFDLAIRRLALRQSLGGVYFGQITGFEKHSRSAEVRIHFNEREGRFELVGPADRDQYDFPMGYSVNGEMFPADPS
jgi:hypothetical protein